jgi:hypothetical protein
VCGIDFIHDTSTCILSYSENGILIYDYLKYIVLQSFNGFGYYCFVIEHGKKALVGSESLFVCYDIQTGDQLWSFKEKNIPIYGFHKTLVGFIIDSQIHFLSKKLISELE